MYGWWDEWRGLRRAWPVSPDWRRSPTESESSVESEGRVKGFWFEKMCVFFRRFFQPSEIDEYIDLCVLWDRVGWLATVPARWQAVLMVAATVGGGATDETRTVPSPFGKDSFN